MGLLEDWGTLIEAQQIRFGITAYDDPMEALTRLRQSTTMVAYKSEFEALSKAQAQLLSEWIEG